MNLAKKINPGWAINKINTKSGKIFTYITWTVRLCNVKQQDQAQPQPLQQDPCPLSLSRSQTYNINSLNYDYYVSNRSLERPMGWCSTNGLELYIWIWLLCHTLYPIHFLYFCIEGKVQEKPLRVAVNSSQVTRKCPLKDEHLKQNFRSLLHAST